MAGTLANRAAAISGPSAPRHAVAPNARISVVVTSYNRRDELLRTLQQLSALPERPPVVVVDNGSTDGTSDAVRASWPSVELVQLERPRGPSARNLGVARVSTPYVAFADDDSWWAPGALSHAADALDRYSRLGLVAARVLVGPQRRPDVVSRAMADSPLPPRRELPGVPIMGFLACGAVIRRRAFDDVGGFNANLRWAGEEALLAIDLAEAGWGMSYVDAVVAHHYPSPARDEVRRRLDELHSRVSRAWLRLPAGTAVRTTWSALTEARRARSWPAFRHILAGLAVALRDRRVVSEAVLRDLRLIGALP